MYQHYPNTKFCHCSLYGTLDIYLFCYPIRKTMEIWYQIMQIWWKQIQCTTTTHISSFVTVDQIEVWIFDFVLAAIRTTMQMLYKIMHIWWQETWWVTLVPTTTTHMPSLFQYLLQGSTQKLDALFFFSLNSNPW